MCSNGDICPPCKAAKAAHRTSESELNDLLCFPSYQAAKRACGLYERAMGENPSLDKKDTWQKAVNRSLLERELIGKALEEA